MQRAQFAAGLVLLVLGLGAIAFTVLEFPHTGVNLNGSALLPETSQSLPAQTVVPSNAVVGLMGLPAHSFLFVNYSATGPTLASTSLAVYLLNSSQWAAYNLTLGQGDLLPNAWVFSVADQAAGSWSSPTGACTSFALLYLDMNGGSVSVNESAFTSPAANGTLSTPVAVPPNVVLASHPAIVGRVIDLLPTMDSRVYAIGGAFQLNNLSGSGARLYLLSPNNSTSCPATSFDPVIPSCQGAYAQLGVVGGGASSASWFALVHGTAKGWSLVFLSSLDAETPLHYNVTEWDLPAGTVLDTPTILTAIGAISGFFGFLALTGSFVRSAERVAPRPSTDTVVRPDRPFARRVPAIVSGTARGPSVVEKRAVSPAPETAVLGPRRLVRPATAFVAAFPADGRVTCGLCGTGYRLKPSGPSCPVCGSKSVVFTAAKGLELR